MDPKKRSLGASERDEEARDAWRERLRSVDSGRLVFVDESSTNIAMVARYARAPKGERARGKAPRNWGRNVTLVVCSISLGGVGPSMSVEGAADGESFSLYLKEFLCPALRPGQIVVMDNLSVHKSHLVRELIEARGCQLWFLPAYSPDLNPIEEVFGKVKNSLRKAKARTLGALFEATHLALGAVSAGDARGFFSHSGYGTLRAHPF